MEQPLLVFLLLALPAEMAASSFSGKDFKHYYAAWLPVCALILGRQAQRLEVRRLHPVILSVLVLAMLYAPVRSFFTPLGDLWWRTTMTTVEYVRQNTDNTSYIQVIGLGGEIYRQTNRPAASRYFFSMPLITRVYATKPRIDIFLSDIRRNRPEVFIDMWNVIPPSKYRGPEGLQTGLKKIMQDYDLVRTLPAHGADWRIYKLKNKKYK